MAPLAQHGERARLTALGTLAPAVWLALIAADRVDFLGGQATFALTPYLVLTPLYLAFELLRLGLLRERVLVLPGAKPYVAAVCALVAIAFTSALLGIDVQASARRALLLLLLVAGTLLAAVLLAARGAVPRVFVLGSKLGLVIALAFNLGQVVAFFAEDLRTVSVGPGSVDLAPLIYGAFPRLSGALGDANRAGLVYLFNLYSLGRWDEPGRRRRAWIGLAVALLLLTLSRSALLGGLAVGATAFLTSSRVTLPRPALAAGGAVTGLVVAAIMLGPDLSRAVVTTAEPVTERFSPSEGSAETHLYLMGRGVEEATESVRRTALGVGYGNANLLLQDVFPGDEYGNFHTVYLTMWTEAGIFALVLIVVLMGVPALRPGPLRPLMVGVMVFNVSYQSNAEPIFWLMLATAWLLMDSAARRSAAEGRP